MGGETGRTRQRVRGRVSPSFIGQLSKVGFRFPGGKASACACSSVVCGRGVCARWREGACVVCMR